MEKGKIYKTLYAATVRITFYKGFILFVEIKLCTSWISMKSTDRPINASRHLTAVKLSNC